jgi:tetratricopeptide (TPR) repeat protein
MDTISAEGRTAHVFSRGAVSRRVQYLALGAFVVCYVALKIGSTASRSATFDEPLHLAAGYSALVERDYRIDPTHPPFVRMWAAAPLLLTGARPLDAARVDASAPGDWLLSSVGEARRFLYGQHDADSVLRAARLAVAFWGLVLGLLVFAWTREWLGPAAAIVAVGLYTCEPNLAAHAALVTTDLPVTCFMFAASYFLWRDVRRPTVSDTAALAIATAFAIVTKFSGLLLLPVIAIMLAAFARRRGPLTWSIAGAIGAAVMAVTFIGIWAAYGFRYEPSATAGWTFHLERSPLVDANASLIAPAAAWLDAHHVFPNAFTQGALVSVAASRTQSMYLLGQISTEGWWYYFPLAFLIKTPLALVILCACGIWAALHRRLTTPSPWLFIAVPLAVVILAGVLSGINIGVRHILAIYPFVVVLAAHGAAWLWRRGRHLPRLTAAGLATAIVIQFAAIYPHTLTFFSPLVGGPDRATRYLADSNIDWGQHLNLVKEWMDRNRVDHINLAYFGTADPAYYGINATLLPGTPAFDGMAIGKPQLPGYVAVSVNMLSGQYLPPEWRLYYREFGNLTPVAVLGNTIRVYWVGTWPEPEEDVADEEDVEVVRALARGLAGIKAYRHAALHFREILERNPNDARALARLGVVLVQSGETDEGLRSLQVASDLAPGDALIRYDQGISLLTAGQVGRAESRALVWLNLAPQDHRAHYLLAAVRQAQGRSDDAIMELDRALRIDPSFAPAREAMAALRAR